MDTEDQVIYAGSDDCAWCGTGEGLCASCAVRLLEESSEIAATGEHRAGD